MLWMLLLIIIISLPIGILSFFFSRKILKKFSGLLGKIDTFDSLIRLKKHLLYIYKTKVLTLFSRARKVHHQPVLQEEKTLQDTLDDIIKPKVSSSKYLDDEEPISSDDDDKVTMIKKRKLLEKIIYEAL